MIKKTISLDKLILSDDNPRLSIYDDTKDLLEEMLLDQQDKIYYLAEDILLYGINPLDTWAVYPATNPPDGKYKVAEGNRRLSAIIILNEPEIIKNVNPRLYARFKKLLDTNNNQPPREIECAVFESWEDTKLQHWIQLRHLGLNRGKGIDQWDSVQKSRYEHKLYGISALVDFWSVLVEKDILSYEQIAAISKTNWERILNKKGRLYLGLGRNQKNYILPSSDDKMKEFVLRIKKIAEKLAHQTVAIVYDNDKIQELLNTIHEELYGKTIDDYVSTLDLSVSDSLSDSVSSIPLKSDDIGAINDFSLTQPSTLQRDLFNNCKTVIPYNFQIRSSNHRINSIIKELKTLEVEKYQNACGTLCRLLFELSAKQYIESNITNKDETDNSFTKALTEASNHLKTNNKLSKEAHSALAKDKDNLRLLFNGYMHNTTMYPSSATIKNLFKSHKDFIKMCLD